MDIAIHLGAHCTDEDLIAKTLGRNAAALAKAGVVVAPSGRMRPAIRKALQARGGSLVPGAADGLIGEMLGGMPDPAPNRIVLSYEGFLGVYAKVLGGDALYGDAGTRAEGLRDLFPGQDVRFYLAMRNPATFIPALFRASSVEDFESFIAGQDLAALCWSEPIEAIRAACPDVPLTVWCNEDLPLIWPDLLRAVAGVSGELKGEDAILRQIMTPAGFARLEVYLRDNPTRDLATRRKVATAFLRKYVDETKIDEEIALPGWSEEMIAGLTALYEQDLDRIRGRADVTFLQP
ncbi:hypothetical protein [Jannaschia ovalis]|uniref:Uncharacterized protein n=1 Tax=Jannaschia ovalis TaxID=3038773 RepID=A0ABY8LCB6_9RHOB|nr:hypothetical protein [Jannaschia sp. GRR-S6-38]WGH77925.1 hypothetical protein P8627_12900 [Jannaschia sp. GRR-S6-38]